MFINGLRIWDLRFFFLLFLVCEPYPFGHYLLCKLFSASLQEAERVFHFFGLEDLVFVLILLGFGVGYSNGN